MEPSGMVHKPSDQLQPRPCDLMPVHHDQTPGHTQCIKTQYPRGPSYRLYSNAERRECEMPKENRCPQQGPAHWCETPKLSKRDVGLRRRLLTSKSATDGKWSVFRTPSDGDTQHQATFESPDDLLSGPLSYSTLKSDAESALHRKRRLRFSQAVTSTVEEQRDGVCPSPQNETLSEPDLDESIISGLLPSETPEVRRGRDGDCFQTPVNRLAADLSESLSVLSTPSCTLLSKLEASEDSGFSSLRLDGSEDSPVDDSFQEGVQSQNRRDQRRARLERQRRLSTLREGSQSEDELAKGQRVKGYVLKLDPDDVFAETPPFRRTQCDLILTPALQAIHALSHSFSLSRDFDLPIVPDLNLAHLIGRKMGLGPMDILTELSLRSLRHVLGSILQLLSARDLYACSRVSESWSDIVLQDRKANRRKKMYEREQRHLLEVGGAARVAEAETRLALACRTVLGSVQAQAKTPSATTLIRTPPFTKHQQFIQVGKTLFSDECLRPCPRCEHPARCHSVKAEGVCSWNECVFRFCTSCLRAYHGSADCSRLPNTHACRKGRSQLLPGSTQSKRNVRRL